MGSVFSPYYAWARMGQERPDPEDFVSLNVALYTPDKKYWCMTERGRRQLVRTETTFSVGPSNLTWSGGKLIIDLDEVTVPVPRRVRGRITLSPHALTEHPFALDAAGRHAWWPLAPHADVTVNLAHPDWSWRGSGYLDHNSGSEPLEDAFASWTWSRTPFSNRSLLLYDAIAKDGTPRGLALEADVRGGVQSVPQPPPVGLPRTAWRLDRSTRSDAPARLARSLEDGPFYARASIETMWDGERGIGVHEMLSLDRFRNRIVQAMLTFRMPRRTWLL